MLSYLLYRFKVTDEKVDADSRCRQQKLSNFKAQMANVITVDSVCFRSQLCWTTKTLQISKTRVVPTESRRADTDGWITGWSRDWLCTSRFANLNAFWIQNAFFQRKGELLYAGFVLSCRCYGNLKLDYHCKSATMVLTSWKFHSSIILVQV